MISEPQWNHATPAKVSPHFPSRPYVIECPTCGFEPADQDSIHYGRCPKCHSFTWQRVALGGRLVGGQQGVPHADA